MEKPLTSKYKGLLTASYQTPLGLWQFDVTLQLNGGGRMPAPYELTDGNWSWERRYGGFDATMVWGPMHGAKAYVGVRFNLPRI